MSEIDQKIILELQKNGRISYTELAAKLDISLTTAASRTEKLIESKVVEIRAVPNPRKIGWSANAVIFIQADPSRIDTICDAFVDHFNVITILTIFGRYDILVFVSFPTWDETHHFINNQLSKIKGILKIEPHFVKQYLKRYENIFGDISVSASAEKLSDTDLKLIHELAKNGRAGLNEVASRIGIHVSNVSRKLRYLLDHQIIKIVAIPNAFKFGFNASAFIYLDIEPSAVDAICKKLKVLPELITLATLINGTGVMMAVQADYNITLYKFIKEKVARFDGILKIESFISAEMKKKMYGWQVGTSDLKAI